MMSLLVAGACHDHEHPGFNNVYLVDTKDAIALRYNGRLIADFILFRCLSLRKSSRSFIILSYARTWIKHIGII